MDARITIIIYDVDQEDRFDDLGQPDIERELEKEIKEILDEKFVSYDDIEVDFENN